MGSVWQIAAGAAGRFYSDVFFRYDVMLLGPGHLGAFTTSAPEYDKWPNKSSVQCLRRLVHEIKAGDLIVVRNGLRAEGIGIVADEEYEWNDSFGDIHGWDLQHSRRVIWQDNLRQDLLDLQADGKPLFHHMKQMVSLTRMHNDSSLPQLQPFFDRVQSRELRPLPPLPAKRLDIEEIGQELFAKGLANDAVDKVLSAIIRQRRLLSWYYSQDQDGSRPTEHEVVAHIILPLLLALGWSEQLVGVEWKKVDVALFRSTPTNQDSCALVCEAKAGHHGLQDVVFQARRYIRELKLIHCRKILVTQGGRFTLYEEVQGEWRLSGYLNIFEVRKSYLFPEGTNGIDTLMALTPTGVF